MDTAKQIINQVREKYKGQNISSDIILEEMVNTALTRLPISNKPLLAAGKLALSARLVTTSNVKNLSQRIENMESDLDAYDNEILALSNEV